MAPRSSYFLTYPLFLLFLLLVLLVVLVGDTARKNRMLFDPLAPLTLAEEEVRPEPIQARSSLEFRRAIYADPHQPIHRRMRAAIAALPFEHPKLAVTASLGPNSSFGARLEDAIARSGRVLRLSATAEEG